MYYRPPFWWVTHALPTCDKAARSTGHQRTSYCVESLRRPMSSSCRLSAEITMMMCIGSFDRANYAIKHYDLLEIYLILLKKSCHILSSKSIVRNQTPVIGKTTWHWFFCEIMGLFIWCYLKWPLFLLQCLILSCKKAQNIIKFTKKQNSEYEHISK